ncbi:hypothetical protein D3C76_1307220 [compost metagenome]
MLYTLICVVRSQQAYPARFVLPEPSLNCLATGDHCQGSVRHIQSSANGVGPLVATGVRFIVDRGDQGDHAQTLLVKRCTIWLWLQQQFDVTHAQSLQPFCMTFDQHLNPPRKQEQARKRCATCAYDHLGQPRSDHQEY